MNEKSVKFDGNGIWIDGEYKILLCASLFYFRIPHELWLDRIKKIKKIGYNCIDVYFPWNFHETSPGAWNFCGDKDVEEFLKLLAEQEMYVIARPGPYICSEWDGGALPAWILAGEDPIREAHEGFLEKVDTWYSKIMPIIARYQCNREGTVVSVQLDNELDFFDCPDPKAYMSALKNMALKYGVEVPIFGCAGQGDAQRATGFAEGIETTFNFYPNLKDGAFDYCCYTVYSKMKDRQKPLLVTETSNDYFILRRELACGAKLIGAYNQVAGTNFGFTNGLNNWGKGETPLSFITSDYNFRSDISPAGEYGEQILEGRLFSGLINSFKTKLALARSCMQCDFKINTDFKELKYGYPALKLQGGGWLLCVPNISETVGKVKIIGNDINFETKVDPFRAPFFPINIPLDMWGIKGMLEWSSAEIAYIGRYRDTLSFIMYSDDEGEACFMVNEMEYISGVIPKGNKIILSGTNNFCKVKQGNNIIYICIVSREKVARYEIDADEWKIDVPSKREIVDYDGDVNISKNINLWNKKVKNTEIAPFEKNNFWRGYGYYKINSKQGLPILLKGVADVISAYEATEYVDTRISGCQWQYYESIKNGEWNFRVESWGHSNFDDSRLQGMKLKSMKGIEAAFEVTEIQDISDCWAFDYYDGDVSETLKSPLKGFESLLSLNSWNSTRVPVKALYRRNIVPRDKCDSFILFIEENEALSDIYVDGIKIAKINPLDPYIDISKFVTAGKSIEVAVATIKKNWSEPVGILKLLHCKKINNCKLNLLSDREVPHVVDVASESMKLPVKFDKGTVNVLAFDLDNVEHRCTYACLKGRDVKITSVFNDRVVGRLFLEGDIKGFMTGGDPFKFYLPGPWFKENGNKLKVLIEAVGSNPLIEGLTLEYVSV